MRRSIRRLALVTVAVAACLLCNTVTQAKPPQAAYTIIPIPSPGGETVTAPYSISDVGLNGEVYLVGYYHFEGEDQAHRWTVNMEENVTFEIEDLSRWFWHHELDVNSAGAICGWTNTEPRAAAVLLPDGTFVELPTYSSVRLNNPDESGVFQVVGGYVMWDIASDGTVLATTSLEDPTRRKLYATDINDFGQIAGCIVVDGEQVPAVGSFDFSGELQISIRANPNPNVIETFSDFQIDNGGDLLGDGREPNPDGWPGSFYSRAVVWPAAGDAIDLVSEFRELDIANGGGIATVNGVMQVVGSGNFPFLYKQGEVTDLNRLAEGDERWQIEGVSAINSSGIIRGAGKVGKRRDYRRMSCLLIPNQ